MVVIAVDLGGSKIKAALVNSDLSVDYSLKVPTNSSKGKRAVLDSLTNSIDLLVSKTKKKISAIGISMPGVIKNNKIFVIMSVLDFLTDFPLVAFLEKKFNIPVLLANDADCFTLAESTFGAGKDFNKVLGVIWGSGLGSGLVVKNHDSNIIISNSELGGVPIYDFDKKKFIFAGFLVAGLSVENEYAKKTGKKLSMKEIFHSKDVVAKHLVKKMIYSLAKALVSAVFIVNPDIVVLGGGVSNLPVLRELKKEMKKDLPPIYWKHFKLKRFEISDDSGFYGAAILALGIEKSQTKKNKK